MKVVDSSSRIGLKNIMLATDFSEPSEEALRYAAALARRYESRIFLTHVIPPEAFALTMPEAVGAMLEEAKKTAEGKMKEFVASGRVEALQPEIIIGQGEIWPVLSSVIPQHDIDLVVVGTHGRTGLERLVLGSVAEEIFRQAPCPVLTVGPRVRRPVPEVVDFKEIVYATDFNSASEFAPAYAFSLAQEYQARLTLLHVVEEVVKPTPYTARKLTDLFEKQLRQLVPPEAELWSEPEYSVEFGEAAEGILRAASARMAELIVLGVRPSSRFARYLAATTAYQVATQALSPVLIVRG